MNGIRKVRATGLATAVLAAPAAAWAGLPSCTHPDVAERMYSHFDDLQESRTPPGPRRARKLESVVETGQGANEGLLTPAGYRNRWCEADLRLDDNSTLHVFIVLIGMPDDRKPDAEAIETCWADRRFPRYAEGCKTEVAPSRR